MIDDKMTDKILGCCFEVMNELGCGFLEGVYKNALCVALRENGLIVEVEKRFEVTFRNRKIGNYIADLIVDGTVIIELKSCEKIIPQHQAQLINYLKASGVMVGLLVNFGNQRLGYKRVCHPDHFSKMAMERN